MLTQNAARSVLCFLIGIMKVRVVFYIGREVFPWPPWFPFSCAICDCLCFGGKPVGVCNTWRWTRKNVGKTDDEEGREEGGSEEGRGEG